MIVPQIPASKWYDIFSNDIYADVTVSKVAHFLVDNHI